MTPPELALFDAIWTATLIIGCGAGFVAICVMMVPPILSAPPPPPPYPYPPFRGVG